MEPNEAGIPDLDIRIRRLANAWTEPELGSRLREKSQREELRSELRELEKDAGAAGRAELTSALAESREQLKRLRSNTSGFTASLMRLLALVSQGETAVVEEARLETGNDLAQDPQLLAEFFMEAREHLVNVEAQLLHLEQKPGDSDALNSLFRSFHTVKGLAGFLEFGSIQEVAHEAETVLDAARNGTLELTPEVVDAVLGSRDSVERWLAFLESGGRGGVAPPTAPVIERLRGLARCQPGSHEAEPAAQGPECEPAEPVRPAAAPPEETAPATAEAEAPEPGTSPAAPAGAAPAPAAPGSATNDVPKAQASENAAVKVNTAKLEYLVDMIGELVIAQSLLRHDQDLAGLRAPRLHRNMAQLARVTAEVQKTAMALRMVPIGNLFRKMQRLVRDLARKTGKATELEMAGEEVELDRTLVEELSDPLVHMLRNSVDHGLERREERVAAGKAETGRIELRARHEAGQIVIEIEDDGRGLNRDRILKKARERGLVSELANPSDEEAWRLIFEAGFSTAEKVTEVSGRGVGMDVVRRQVEKLRGRIEVESRLGRGTLFRLRLPLTLAIIDGLVVGVGEERFIVPIPAVREMIRPAREMLFTVEGRHEMALVRDRLLPMVRLSERLGVKPKSEDPCEGLLIVGESEEGRFCLLVDEMLGKQEVVIKSLGPVFQRVSGLAGGAILGDGRVGLILEMTALRRRTSVREEAG